MPQDLASDFSKMAPGGIVMTCHWGGVTQAPVNKPLGVNQSEILPNDQCKYNTDLF